MDKKFDIIVALSDSHLPHYKKNYQNGTTIYRCPRCNLFMSVKKLNEHLRRVSKPGIVFTCYHCDGEF